MSKNNQSNNIPAQQVQNYVKSMEPQPYISAHEEITSVISNTNNPANFDNVDIDLILDTCNMGPNTDHYSDY